MPQDMLKVPPGRREASNKNAGCNESGSEMPGQLRSAKDVLQEKRHANPNWSRLLIRPIRLRDGTVLFTLRDAAEKILELPASPSARVAAARIIEAATRDRDMASTHAAIRMALLKDEAGARS